MKKLLVALCASLVTALTPAWVYAQETAGSGRSAITVLPAAAPSGAHDFDFEIGSWRVHHRVLRGGRWIEFDGTCRNARLIDGSANVEEHTFNRPEGISYGVGMRAFDAETLTWAIWWIDSRQPHLPMDPPVIGRFENGVGRFYADGVVESRTIRTRYQWSHLTANSARWEQASSEDGGQNWATNWIMEFERIS